MLISNASPLLSVEVLKEHVLRLDVKVDSPK